MKKQCKPWMFLLLNITAVLNLLCYYSIRSMWSGIIRYTIEPLPYILLAVIFFCALVHTLYTIKRRYPVLVAVFTGIINVLFLALNAGIIAITLDAASYFIREFLYSAFFLFIIGIIYWAITRLHKYAIYEKKWFSPVLFTAIIAIALLFRCDFSFFNAINSTPVVYAVEDTYQIVFTSRSKGTGWVTIDGVDYNDTYAGYRKTEDTVHKIKVPMAALDNAGSYTISTRSMILRGPYSALQGEIISKTYYWKGVTPEDGLNYYVLSDTHNTWKGPSSAGSYFGNSLDFLISCGDNSSWNDREADLTQMLRLAGKITNGAVPVIYARGNHETKGVMAHEFYKYVGSKDQNFYYTFRLKNVWGVVLDIGEDHRDKYEEFYGAAKFNAYRRAQTQFLDDILDNAEQEFDAEDVDYRIAICHIPVTLKYSNDHAKAYKDAWIKRLNKMKLTMMYSGHVHQLWFIDDSFEDGTVLTLSPHYSGTTENNKSRIMTNAKFPSILVSRRSEGQLLTYPEYVFDKGFWGLAVSSDGVYTTMRYTNEKHEVMENITCPWYEGIDYGSTIVVENVK